MPRYIDAEELKATLKANDWSNPCVPIVVNMIIDRSPTADVAPRSEVAFGILNEVDNLLWRHKMRGFINLDLIHNDIVKLKKKYTGDKTDGTSEKV